MSAITQPNYPERHEQGHLMIENADVIDAFDKSNCDVGIQIATDGRIWLCVNGVAFIRFSPHANGKMRRTQEYLEWIDS